MIVMSMLLRLFEVLILKYQQDVFKLYLEILNDLNSLEIKVDIMDLEARLKKVRSVEFRSL